ncbi:MAG: TlpA disulfide reductase family protein [Balneolaceae bacterium]
MQQYFTLLLIIALTGISCTNEIHLEGTLDYSDNTTLTIHEFPIHYKYSPVKKDTISVSEDGSFSISVHTDSQSVAYLEMDDKSYPLILTPGENLFISISRADFPSNTQIKGYPDKWNENFIAYLEAIRGFESQITEEVEKIKVGKKHNLLSLSKRKYELASQFLANTPLHIYYQKAVGEYLVYKVRAIEYNARNFKNFDADSARSEVFKEAKELQFFSEESLKAQRAGIRDFSHYYSRTFGIYDSVKHTYEKDLAEYDIKKIAYEELNDKRLQVLEHITDRNVLAYAEMYLVAERIGEQSLEIATPSYLQYLNDYSDFPEYTTFLTYFYEEIKTVSPGEPAVAFSLPDLEGNLHTMEEYRGKFVLLDFWAGWCIPCLDEFPYMKDIYKKYSRDELEILAISTEADSLIWVQDINRFDNPWQQLYGGKAFEQETFKAYKGGGIPFYILVDPDGKISRYNDIRPSFNFETVLDSLLLQYNLSL